MSVLASVASPSVRRAAVVGGGWAGLAAAVRAAHDGHHVTVFEASRHWGGRARSLPLTLPDGSQTTLDNGQHILIGAYTETLRLMQMVGVDVASSLFRTPLALIDPNGHGLRLPDWPAIPDWLSARVPLDVLAGVLGARGWTWRDKWALLWTATRWQMAGFVCPDHTTVSDLCQGVPTTLMDRFFEPLCVSALNTPASRASGKVFLRVLQDSLFGVRGGSNLLLPCVDLGALFPHAAVAWLQQAPRSAVMRLGQRVVNIQAACEVNTGAPAVPGTGGWQLNGEHFDHVVWANSDTKWLSAHDSIDSTALKSGLIDAQPQVDHPCESAPESSPTALDWADAVRQLRHEAIATVYVWCGSAAEAARTRPLHATEHVLPQAMTALLPNAVHPAQFVFDRSWLGGPIGLLAFVVSASEGDAKDIESRVCRQAKAQLALEVTAVRTVVEKRATFACTPGLRRPAKYMAPNLVAAGDQVEGPYPATLEGAVRSGWAAGAMFGTTHAGTS